MEPKLPDKERAQKWPLPPIGSKARDIMIASLVEKSSLSMPAAVKDLAAMEGGGMFSNAEQKNWRKYVQLAKDLNEDSVEAEMVECVARYAEGLMRGTGSPNL